MSHPFGQHIAVHPAFDRLPRLLAVGVATVLATMRFVGAFSQVATEGSKATTKGVRSKPGYQNQADKRHRVFRAHQLVPVPNSLRA